MRQPRDFTTAFEDAAFAVIGAVAANQYMPSRSTADIDFAIAQDDETTVTESLIKAGWRRGRALQLRPPLTGWSWATEGGIPVDVISVPGNWGRDLVEKAALNVLDGLPTATLPHLVVLKLFAGRLADGSDISRMLGHQEDPMLQAVRILAGKVLQDPQDLEDLEQLIELGRLEFGGWGVDDPLER